MRRGSILAIVLAGIPAVVLGGSDTFLPLFLVERSTNANVVHYEAKVSNGKLDPQEPVIAYWIMAAENGRREKLTFLERNEAYGFSTERDSSGDSYTIRIVSDRQRPIHVTVNNGSALAITNIGGHRAYLQKIYITTRKVLTVNKTVSAELYGADVATGEKCYEKVMR
jgi:hypothetical protein